MPSPMAPGANFTAQPNVSNEFKYNAEVKEFKPDFKPTLDAKAWNPPTDKKTEGF
jgi:hypothetical protein